MQLEISCLSALVFLIIAVKVLPNAYSYDAGKKFKKKSITKADIGQPQDFKHISHVGFDPNTGFEIGNVDKSILEFFDKVCFICILSLLILS